MTTGKTLVFGWAAQPLTFLREEFVLFSASSFEFLAAFVFWFLFLFTASKVLKKVFPGSGVPAVLGLILFEAPAGLRLIEREFSFETAADVLLPMAMFFGGLLFFAKVRNSSGRGGGDGCGGIEWSWGSGNGDSGDSSDGGGDSGDGGGGCGGGGGGCGGCGGGGD